MWTCLTLFAGKKISMYHSDYKYQIYFYLGLVLAHTVLITANKCVVNNKCFICILVLMYFIYFLFWFLIDIMFVDKS